MKRCTAKSKRSGERCKNAPITGRETCRFHGGTHPVGALAPQHKGKGYSPYLPARLLERYHQAEADTELLALRNDIALIDARLVDVLSRVDSGESGKLWTDLHQASRELKRARRTGDTAAIGTALGELLHLIDTGYSDRAAWDDAVKLIGTRKALVESERKRHVEMQQMLSTAEGMTLAAGLIQAVKDNVSDPVALAAISAAIVRLLGRPDRA